MLNNIKEELKLYLVTDSDVLVGRDFYQCIEEALKAGVTMLQLREKNASGKVFLEKAIKLREITNKYNIPLIINDRVDIAILSDADGVHVGQSDIDAASVRKLIGKDKIVGVSAKNIDEAKKAREDGADYIGMGAIFSTSTKLDANSLSIDIVSEVKSSIDIPIVLIGGINLENLELLKNIDASGYAVVSAILKSNNIYKEVKKWIDAI